MSKIYFIFNKPYNVLTQFTDKEMRQTLSNYYKFPKDVYPVGRLDYDSEGLLILTNDNMLKTSILSPETGCEKEYFAQVEGVPTDSFFSTITNGIVLKNISYKPGKAKLIEDPGFEERVPPVRFRANIPTTWVSIIITEGKNRQIRKMCAAAGNPVLRLVRVRIGNLFLGNLKSGKVIKISGNTIFSNLGIAP